MLTEAFWREMGVPHPVVLMGGPADGQELELTHLHSVRVALPLEATAIPDEDGVFWPADVEYVPVMDEGDIPMNRDRNARARDPHVRVRGGRFVYAPIPSISIPSTTTTTIPSP